MRLIKYGISGGSGAAVNIGSFYVLAHLLHVWYIEASVIAFALSFLVSFSLQRFWTYEHRGSKQLATHATLYLAVALMNLAINTFIVYVLVDAVHVFPVLAQLIAGGIVSITSYFVYTHFIFKKAHA